MNIFISWSKARSKRVAEGLADLIKVVVEGAQPWVSIRIGGGEEFVSILHQHLDEADFAIICLTEDTRESRWIFYELGSLISKGVKVCPYLIDPDMHREELPLPLPGRQSRRANESETLELLREIKLQMVSELSEQDEKKLKESFDSLWPRFNEVLRKGRLRTAEDALAFCQERVSDAIALSQDLDRYCGFLESRMYRVIREALSLYDSRRAEIKTEPVESDPIYLELVDQIEEIAWQAIEGVRGFFNYWHRVVGDVRQFLTVNYEREELRAFIIKAARTLGDDSGIEAREEQLKKEVRIEICSVFFKFQQKAAESLFTSFRP
ncbi:MAG: TIR domain-containing protein [Pyrinomonadaceae bacterium]